MGNPRGNAVVLLVRRRQLALTFEAFPNKPGLRDQPVDRPLGAFVDYTTSVVRGEGPLAGALKRKQPNRYSELDLPFAVAVSETSLIPFDDSASIPFGDPASHRANVMFGTPEIDFGGGSGPRWVRRGNGVWQGPGARPRNRRLAACSSPAVSRPGPSARHALNGGTIRSPSGLYRMDCFPMSPPGASPVQTRRARSPCRPHRQREPLAPWCSSSPGQPGNGSPVPAPR